VDIATWHTHQHLDLTDLILGGVIWLQLENTLIAPQRQLGLSILPLHNDQSA
jgi:hypothetical protein